MLAPMRLDVDLTALNRGDADAAVWSADAPGSRRADTAGVTLVIHGRPRDATSGTELDAAALLMRYRRLGIDTARGLHGAYAIAVVDTGERRVLLLNDRMAQHGWCHARSGDRLRVSPRADAIADGAELEPQALFSYLFNHVVPSPDTVFRGVGRLPPGHRLVVDAAGATEHPHWEPVFAPVRQPDFAALRDEFRALLKASVAREAGRSDAGATGAFLSGGTDSSTVAGLLQEVAGGPVRAYSIGFDADGYDEMAYARIAARRFGLDHREHYLTPDEVAQAMPLVAGHYDQPFGNSSAVATYHCARVAQADGCAALLAGDGGDELFGGNTRYAKQTIFHWYRWAPGPLRRGVLEPLLANDYADRIPGVAKAASYVSQASVPMPDRLHMYNLLPRLGLDQVLAPRFHAQVDPFRDLARHRRTWERSAGASLIDRMLAYDWKYTLADNDLPKVVGTSGLAGIAAAFPLLGDEVIDFSLRLPARDKLRGLKLRWFFKEALRGFLPDEMLTKKKQGFGLPFGVWLLEHASLKRLVDDALGSFAGRGVVAPGFLARLQDELLPSHPGYYGELVWIFVMLELWLRQHRPDWRLAE